MAYWVETFDDVLAQLQKQGYVVGQTGSPLGEHSRFAYVFQPSRPDAIVEISEYLGTKRALYEAIEMHSQNWDGRDPIRTWSPLSSCADDRPLQRGFHHVFLPVKRVPTSGFWRDRASKWRVSRRALGFAPPCCPVAHDTPVPHSKL